MIKSMKYYGFYRGEVLQCLNNGFCRIRIPDILECIDENINTLPIAEPAQSIGGGDSTLDGTFAYPALNSIVWCFFEGGNIQRPVYFAMSNVKSKSWNDVSIRTKNSENTGNNGGVVKPTGQLMQFNKSMIHQQVMYDVDVNKPVGDKLDITVLATSRQENNYVDVNESKKNGFASPVAANIHMDNINNILTLTAKHMIVLKAPNIIIDSTGLERAGYVLVKSDEIDNVTNSGPFRVLNSKVNIDSGNNDIVFQTKGRIWELRSRTPTALESDKTV